MDALNVWVYLLRAYR